MSCRARKQVYGGLESSLNQDRSLVGKWAGSLQTNSTSTRLRPIDYLAREKLYFLIRPKLTTRTQ